MISARAQDGTASTSPTSRPKEKRTVPGAGFPGWSWPGGCAGRADGGRPGGCASGCAAVWADRHSRTTLRSANSIAIPVASFQASTGLPAAPTASPAYTASSPAQPQMTASQPGYAAHGELAADPAGQVPAAQRRAAGQRRGRLPGAEPDRGTQAAAQLDTGQRVTGQGTAGRPDGHPARQHHHCRGYRHRRSRRVRGGRPPGLGSSTRARRAYHPDRQVAGPDSDPGTVRSCGQWRSCSAAGSGLRFGAAIPKQLLPLAGRALLEHSVAAFERAPGVDEILIVMAPGHTGQVRDLLTARGYEKVTGIIEGGASPARIDPAGHRRARARASATCCSTTPPGRCSTRPTIAGCLRALRDHRGGGRRGARRPTRSWWSRTAS